MAAGRSHVDLFQINHAVLPLFAARVLLLHLFLFALPCVLSEFVPTAPGPGDAFIAGTECTLQWNADAGGSWNNVTIDLMSGSNDNMTIVTNVIVGLNGTDFRLSPFTWICPEVDPYSSIYFYQFSMSGNKTMMWTTRFAIAAPNGDLFLPEHSRQPNGDVIPWGTGHLVGNSSQQTNTSTALPSSVCDKHATNLTNHEQSFHHSEDATTSDLNSLQTANFAFATRSHPSSVSASGNALFTGTSSARGGHASQRSCTRWMVYCAVAAMWLVD